MLIISTGRSAAKASAKPVLPEAVGPKIAKAGGREAAEVMVIAHA